MYKNVREVLDSFRSYQGSDLLHTPNDITMDQIQEVLSYGYMCTISDGNIFFTLMSTGDVDSCIEKCLQLVSEWYSKVATRLNFLSIDYDIRMSDLVLLARNRKSVKSFMDLRE